MGKQLRSKGTSWSKGKTLATVFTTSSALAVFTAVALGRDAKQYAHKQNDTPNTNTKVNCCHIKIPQNIAVIECAAQALNEHNEKEQDDNLYKSRSVALSKQILTTMLTTTNVFLNFVRKDKEDSTEALQHDTTQFLDEIINFDQLRRTASDAINRLDMAIYNYDNNNSAICHDTGNIYTKVNVQPINSQGHAAEVGRTRLFVNVPRYMALKDADDNIIRKGDGYMNMSYSTSRIDTPDEDHFVVCGRNRIYLKSLDAETIMHYVKESPVLRQLHKVHVPQDLRGIRVFFDNRVSIQTEPLSAQSASVAFVNTHLTEKQMPYLALTTMSHQDRTISDQALSAARELMNIYSSYPLGGTTNYMFTESLNNNQCIILSSIDCENPSYSPLRELSIGSQVVQQVSEIMGAYISFVHDICTQHIAKISTQAAEESNTQGFPPVVPDMRLAMSTMLVVVLPSTKLEYKCQHLNDDNTDSFHAALFKIAMQEAIQQVQKLPFEQYHQLVSRVSHKLPPSYTQAIAESMCKHIGCLVVQIYTQRDGNIDEYMQRADEMIRTVNVLQAHNENEDTHNNEQTQSNRLEKLKALKEFKEVEQLHKDGIVSDDFVNLLHAQRDTAQYFQDRPSYIVPREQLVQTVLQNILDTIQRHTQTYDYHNLQHKVDKQYKDLMHQHFTKTNIYNSHHIHINIKELQNKILHMLRQYSFVDKGNLQKHIKAYMKQIEEYKNDYNLQQLEMCLHDVNAQSYDL